MRMNAIGNDTFLISKDDAKRLATKFGYPDDGGRTIKVAKFELVK
jgi:hypothetical protein